MKIGKYVIHHYFVNNCISSMMRGIADFFQHDIFERSNEIIISTYNKGVQHYKQRMENNNEKFVPSYPFLLMDPGIDFEPDPQMGRFLYKYPTFHRYFLEFGEIPIYQDENVILTLMTNWMKGSFDIYAWCSSVRELMDFKMIAINAFASHGRYIIPNDIKGYVVLPDEITAYSYVNSYTDETYFINWDQNNIKLETIKNIGKNKRVYMFDLNPWIRYVEGPETTADKYGGGDELSSYRLDMRCEWECNIPVYFTLKWKEEEKTVYKKDSIFRDENARIVVDIDFSYEYICREDLGMDRKHVFPKRKLLDSYGEDKEIDEKLVRKEEELVLEDILLYTITDLDMEAFNMNPKRNIIINLGRVIEDPYKLEVRCKYGKLILSVSWEPYTPTSIRLISDNCPFLEEGLNIWIGIYSLDNT